MYNQIEEIFSKLNISTEIKIKIILSYQEKILSDKGSLTITDWYTIKVLSKMIGKEEPDNEILDLRSPNDEKISYRNVVRHSIIQIGKYENKE